MLESDLYQIFRLELDVDPFGAAGQRNITQGDVILSVGKRDVKNPQEFRNILSGMKAGDAVMLKLKTRGGPVRYVAIQIPEKRAQAN